MTYILKGYPSVATVYRAIPGTVAEIAHKTGIDPEVVRSCVKILLATKIIYCSRWTPEVYPHFEQGDKPNVPRPTKQMVRHKSSMRSREVHKEYLKQYRIDNKEKRKQYLIDNRDHLNAKRRELAALRRQIKTFSLVVEQPKTVWRTV
jgi:hypothetical protein